MLFPREKVEEHERMKEEGCVRCCQDSGCCEAMAGATVSEWKEQMPRLHNPRDTLGLTDLCDGTKPLPLFVPQRRAQLTLIPGRDTRRPEEVPGIWPGLRDSLPRLGLIHEPSHPAVKGSPAMWESAVLHRSVVASLRFPSAGSTVRSPPPLHLGRGHGVCYCSPLHACPT